MKNISIIFFCWKISFLINLIQCEINTTINLLFPSIFSLSNQNLPLSEQAIYDLKNTLRLSEQTIDFDDEDYNEDDETENLIITSPSTTSESNLNDLKSSSSSFHLAGNFLSLFILLSISTTQTKMPIGA